ncbi:hypothetical protein IAG44_17740 [Streptomyces roseirectus]|uniref:Uncharacterized protein n=2 Tax=Streptomyces roseirectus TaxID=2768066 RepID=A0A7H0IE81_9ACTN|nr:hypothetical protein IAG44_17740 [Streptomyces roseirectus]
MNMQQAAESADQIVQRTLSSVVPPLQWTHQTSTDTLCLDATSDSHELGAVTRRAVVMTKVSAERRGGLLGVVERNWKKSGYKITSVNSDKESPAIFAETPDGYRLGLIVGSAGQFFLEVATPCAKKSDVARPKTKAAGQDYYERKVPGPNVDDAFWSAKEPLPSTSPTSPSGNS